MDLYLIRHGESKQNTRENNGDCLPDHKIELSDTGIIQSHDLGSFLKDYVDSNNINIRNAVFWVSPFLRTRQTANIINSYLNIRDVREDYNLIEQRLGLFSGTSIQRVRLILQKEFKHYDNYFQNGGEFYAQLPQGEAPMDVAMRTRMFLNMVSAENRSPVFVVSHNTTIKTMVMNNYNYSPEWFSNEPLMENCSVRLISDDKSKDSFIYGGYVKKR